jgi:hypothetical protein
MLVEMGLNNIVFLFRAIPFCNDNFIVLYRYYVPISLRKCVFFWLKYQFVPHRFCFVVAQRRQSPGGRTLAPTPGA